MDTIRNRIINFRVSEDEFRRLKAASASQKARCLSDFARTVTLRVAGGAETLSEADVSENEIQSVIRHLSLLESNIARLLDVLTKAKNGNSQVESQVS